MMKNLDLDYDEEMDDENGLEGEDDNRKESTYIG